MKLDAHQHFWVYEAAEYDWMDERMGALHRDFLPRDLEREQLPLGFDGSVAVQARSHIEETRWLLELAEVDPRVRGVVGWVDLCAPDVTDSLERFAAHPKCVGMRHVVHDEPDLEFMLRPDFLRGLEALGRAGLVYDPLLRPLHLPVAREVVGRFPDLRFVVDHVAKPRVAERVLSPWDADLRELASFENVLCKLSGLLTEAEWTDWKPGDFEPYLDVVLEAFGPDRCMIGSDWPVCTLAGSYSDAMRVVIDYVEKLAPDERDAILGGTCTRAYGLGAGDALAATRINT